ncbi:MAG: hypothetical protein IKA99_07615 [Clostridia bacterium]|nr:hypothetical protein [Clostridia bacterium]
MKNFEALAVGVVAGLVVSSICCEKPKPKPCTKRLPCEEEIPPCPPPQKPNCKKCYYQRYYR